MTIQEFCLKYRKMPLYDQSNVFCYYWGNPKKAITYYDAYAAISFKHRTKFSEYIVKKIKKLPNNNKSDGVN